MEEYQYADYTLEYREFSDDITILKQVLEQNHVALPDLMQDWKVLDIGAHIGTFSFYAAARGAIVYAFEPTIESYRILRDNIRNNRMGHRIFAFPFGVGRESNQLLYPYPDHAGMNSLVPSFFGNAMKTSVWIPVLDLPKVHALTAVDTFDLTKIDCEGAEEQIIPQLNRMPGGHKRIDLELHYEDKKNQELLDLLRPYYDVQARSTVIYHLELKENYARPATG